MPTPIGHALAGLAIAWSAESIRRVPFGTPALSTVALTGVGLATAPDLDFIYPPVHRMMSHSITAVATVGVLAALVARRANTRAPWLFAVVSALAYASHLALDATGADVKLPAGIQLLWPFTDGWFITSWEVFRATHVQGFFTPSVMLSNGLAVLQELLILGPIVWGAWFLRSRSTGRRETSRLSIGGSSHRLVSEHPHH
jgi:membrane-bound metal-dependent hydrolase YbcI (DUF457 family)